MLGTTELILIFGVAALLFGANKLPELARSIGSSVGEFQKAKIKAENEVKELTHVKDDTHVKDETQKV